MSPDNSVTVDDYDDDTDADDDGDNDADDDDADDANVGCHLTH